MTTTTLLITVSLPVSLDTYSALTNPLVGLDVLSVLQNYLENCEKCDVISVSIPITTNE